MMTLRRLIGVAYFEGLQRFQFIEPITLPKTLVVVPKFLHDQPEDESPDGKQEEQLDEDHDQRIQQTETGWDVFVGIRHCKGAHCLDGLQCCSGSEVRG